MRLLRLVLLGPLAIFLSLTAACATSDTGAVAPARSVDLTGLEIRRIGNDRIHFREFQNRAIGDMLARLAEAGVPREAITNITIDTDASEPGGRFAHSWLSVRYSVWVNIDGCERAVFGSAGATGRITSFRDRGGCLAQW